MVQRPTNWAGTFDGLPETLRASAVTETSPLGVTCQGFITPPEDACWPPNTKALLTRGPREHIATFPASQVCDIVWSETVIADPILPINTNRHRSSRNCSCNSFLGELECAPAEAWVIRRRPGTIYANLEQHAP